MNPLPQFFDIIKDREYYYGNYSMPNRFLPANRCADRHPFSVLDALMIMAVVSTIAAGILFLISSGSLSPGSAPFLSTAVPAQVLTQPA